MLGRGRGAGDHGGQGQGGLWLRQERAGGRGGGWFKAVINVLDAMIRYGVCLARSFELTAQWDRILAVLALCILSLLVILVRFRAWVLVTSIELFPMFIIVTVILFIQLCFVVGMRLSGCGVIGCGRIPWFIPASGSGPK